MANDSLGYKSCRYCNTPHTLKAVNCMFCKEPFRMQLAARFWNRVLNEDVRRVIRVKTILPYFCERKMWWPCLLVDDRSGNRVTITPGWDWGRVRNVIIGNRP
jgi:hypothetical protein